MTDSLEKGKIIHGRYYASELRQLKEEINRNAEGIWRQEYSSGCRSWSSLLWQTESEGRSTPQVAVDEEADCGRRNLKAGVLLRLQYLKKPTVAEGIWKQEYSSYCNRWSSQLWQKESEGRSTLQVAVAEAAYCGFELLLHPPFSSDLAPSDLFLFPKTLIPLVSKQY